MYLLTDEELLKKERQAYHHSKAKVRDVVPEEKSRRACTRADEWLRYYIEVKKRNLQPLREPV
tara:strand:- start:205 stop:393 length:189 start_codon:yes stop_codon:yes gene_type:complete